LYEGEHTASRKRPHTGKVGENSKSSDAIVTIIDTSGMTAAWMSVEKGVRLPVWVDQGRRGIDNADSEYDLWICLEEVKVVLQLDENLGDRDEWFACGFIPQNRIVVRHDSPNTEYPERVFNDEEKEEADKQARHNRRHMDRKRLQAERQQSERRIKRTQSSAFLKVPQIPVRKSSLNTLAGKAVSEPKKETTSPSKLCIDTRDVSVSLTNSDPQRAASLMKYALLMAHGQRFEAEKSWLAETTPAAGGKNRERSSRTIDDGSLKERQDGFSHRDTGAYLTPPESSRGSSTRRDTRGRRDCRGDPAKVSRYEVALSNDDQSSRERGRRTRRSAAPSPSQSMLGYHGEGPDRPSLQPRRSRRDLLLELQSDEDSVLREYARVSLKDPTMHRRTRHDTTNESAESALHNDADSQSLSNLRDRLESSMPTPPQSIPQALPVTRNPNTEDEAKKSDKPPPSSIYTGMSSLSALSNFPGVSIEQAAYASVQPGSHIREIEIRSKKSDASSSTEARPSSEEQRGRSRTGVRRPLEILAKPGPGAETRPEARQEGTRGAEKFLEPFPPFDPTMPDHPEREAPVLPPQPENQPTPSPAVSKSEAFFARSKNLREKGKELSGRLAEVRARQVQKPKAKKDIWELALWKSGEKKDGAK
jgi:hypothetical protein